LYHVRLSYVIKGFTYLLTYLVIQIDQGLGVFNYVQRGAGLHLSESQTFSVVTF